MTRPWATKYNVKVGLALRSGQVTFKGFFQPRQLYISKGLLPFLTSNLLYFCPFHSGAAKRPMQCSEEFRELLAQPTFGARNLCKHWTKTGIVFLPEEDPLLKSLEVCLNKVAFNFVFFFFPRCWKEARGKFPIYLCFSTAQATETEIAGGQKKAIWRDSEAVRHTCFHRKGSVIVALRIAVLHFLFLGFVWCFSLPLALKTIGHSLLVTSPGHSWF